MVCVAGILFVVDSSDKERMTEARDELQKICKADELKGVPMIVIANKQDVKGALGLILLQCFYAHNIYVSSVCTPSFVEVSWLLSYEMDGWAEKSCIS